VEFLKGVKERGERWELNEGEVEMLRVYHVV
jgi:hypothetical protein